MAKKIATAYTNGTSALKMPRWTEEPGDAKIIMFPGSRIVANEPQGTHARAAHAKEPYDRPLHKRVLDRSEMYCSLRFESMLGCPYNLFSKQGIAALSVGATLIGVISLILGA